MKAYPSSWMLGNASQPFRLPPKTERGYEEGYV